MLPSLLKQSFSNQKKAMALMILSVSMGVAVSASLITISMDIKGKVAKELRSFGANIIVEPASEGFAGLAGQKRYLREEDVIKAKTIFWRHNVIGIAPFLESLSEVSAGGRKKNVAAVGAWFDKELPLPGETSKFLAGTGSVLPWWSIEGDSTSVVLGVSLARDMAVGTGGEVLIDGKPYRVSGLLTTGGKEDGEVFMDLDSLQAVKGLEGKVSKVLVSALTTPMDEFAYKDPGTMSRKEYEKWYCTGYVTSIAKQLEEVFKGSRAKPIWQVAETEGKVLGRLSVLIYLLSVSVLLASALGVSTTMIASLLRRIEEIGLMKALGADSLKITLIFLSEAFIIGISGGLIGYVISIFATRFIGIKVFDAALAQRAMLLPMALISALFIAVLGSLLPIRRALKIKPAVVLKGAR